MQRTNTNLNTGFNQISIRLASPERIKEWSHGEVTKPETINYRTQRSERGGLFDEKIFGPEKDYECYCGKYRRIRYKDVICEKCGVEVTRSIVRRERMGHIELASPVAHIWFMRGGGPSRIGSLINISVNDLEKVIYFAGYIITRVNHDERERLLKDLDSEYRSKLKSIKTDEDRDKVKKSLTEVKQEIECLKEGKVLDEITYHRFSLKYGPIFEAEIGAEAIYKIFKNLNLEKMEEAYTRELADVSPAEKNKLLKRLYLIKSLRKAGIKPEWMFLKSIPITPPALRPMVALDGGRHATSDINDLYRRVINRNNRLKKLQEINAPEVIQRNEKRILQEAVDALIDNSIRHGTGAVSLVNQAQRRPLKSLADMLKGKQGRFRQNLLGKRVDYSGRSVIVVGPELKLDQCGLPKHMALELFRPFVVSKLIEQERAFNIRGAGKLIDEGVPEVWAILEQVIQNKYVLLNRAPTLHRLGIQAFRPILIEGNAIQVHPLVCTAFNADFDGDQMAVHVPLSAEAQKEARLLMSSSKNLLRPGNGDPIVTPRLDIVLGCYWMTRIVEGEKGENLVFESTNRAIVAHDMGYVSLRAAIRIKGSDHPKYKRFEGKIFETSVGRLLFNSVLPDDFAFINQEITAKDLALLVEDLIEHSGTEATPGILDKIKNFGYKYVTRSGITWSFDDLKIPKEKTDLVIKGYKEAEKIESKFEEGFLSAEERYRMIIEVWQDVKEEIEKALLNNLDQKSGVRDMLVSKARGSTSNINQMSGMKGLIVNPSGETLDFPIIPSYKEGLSPLEYFVTTHGSRKGLADTALNTAKAGYLTRKLVDVSQDVIIKEKECGNKEGTLIAKKNLSGLDQDIASSIRGRVLAKSVKDKEGKTLYKSGELLMKKDAKKIEEAGVEEVFVRSPLTCVTLRGICQTCYGLDLGRNRLVDLGEAVGIVAAQAIGEPGTQLTMRTFHAGGIASATGDITMGLPRVEEIFEKRVPRNSAILCEVDGKVTEIKPKGKEKVVVVLDELAGSHEYLIPFKRSLMVAVGENVFKGQALSDGSYDISEYFSLAGKEKTENYILAEINKVYSLQGASISRKHVEVIVRQMFSRKRIVDPGDTTFVTGDIVEMIKLLEEVERVEKTGGKPATTELAVLGISEVSLTTSSWLSAASFQNTSRVLIDAALKGEIDNLRGLKENVIIGRLIPAGTGLKSNYLNENQ